MFVFFVILTLVACVENYYPPFSVNIDGKDVAGSLTIDANWRWLRYKDSYENCFQGTWVQKFCPDPVQCFKNCVLEGIPESQWLVPYGVIPSAKSLNIKYVTKGPYGDNIGNRLYVLDKDKKYMKFKLLGKELSFTMDVSKVPCGVNSAMYFVAMNGIPALGGDAYGTGYGDAQCPRDIKYFNGFSNMNKTGSCAVEMDVWEGNSISSAFTPHNCLSNTQCNTDVSCGDGGNRYKGICDKDGADYNPFRFGKVDEYGPNKQINTMKPFTVRIRFITDSLGSLTSIERYFDQDGKSIASGVLTDLTIAKHKKDFKEVNYFAGLGGMKKFGEDIKEGLVLVLSLWDDSFAQMQWLDGTYPTGSTAAGAKRGTCPLSNVQKLRTTVPNSEVTFSNIKLTSLSPKQTETPSVTSVVTLPKCCKKLELKCIDS